MWSEVLTLVLVAPSSPLYQNGKSAVECIYRATVLGKKRLRLSIVTQQLATNCTLFPTIENLDVVTRLVMFTLSKSMFKQPMIDQISVVE